VRENSVSKEIEIRPWGFYVILHTEQRVQVKRIHVQSGNRLSKQSHKLRAEHWYITQGYAEVELFDQILHLGPGDYVSIGVGEVHRVRAEGEMDLVFIEIQTGDYLGEDDIIRYEDDYGRIE
jgi:mannose-6-phosphate isomerase-like protein (cupin superfamily)